MKKFIVLILIFFSVMSYSQTRVVEDYKKAKIIQFETHTKPAILCLYNFLIIDGLGLAISVLTGDTVYLAIAGVSYVLVSIITINNAKKWRYN